MNTQQWVLILITLSSSTVFASTSRNMSGPLFVQEEVFVSNTMQQNLQANELNASGQMNNQETSTLTSQQQNDETQLRAIDGQVGGYGNLAINPPPNFYNQSQQEQINVQERGTDMQLNTAGTTEPPAPAGQQINQTAPSGITNSISTAP